MKQFDDLVAVLQVGTRRASPSPMTVLPPEVGTSPEARVLLLSGTMDLMSRAGVVPGTRIQPEPSCPQELSTVASRSVEPLADAISAGLTEAVLEWANKARALGKVAPPAILVRLLPVAARHPDEVVPVLGNRGRWLANLQGLDLVNGEDDLTARRISDRDAYRDWLATEIGDMDWKQRAQAVAALGTGLTLTDEPLLEEALTDRRKEVREPACDLLAALEGSRVAKELATWADQLLLVEKSLLRKVLAVKPPDPADLPKWLPKTSSRVDFGPKALALFDVVRYVPPHHWEVGVSPEQFVEMAAKTDYSRAIIDGLQEAAIRFENQEWTDVLFEFLFGKDAIKQPCWPDLARRSSEQLFERLVTTHLSGIAANPSTAVWTLTLRRRSLSLLVSQKALLALRTNTTHFYSLRELANYLHPDARNLIEAPYSEEDAFESTRQNVLKVLDIRSRLLASLDD